MGIIKNKLDNRNHVTHHLHTYEPELIKSGGWALDLGCNDFIFSRHLLSLGLKVIALDPIKDLEIPTDLKENNNFFFLEKACVGSKNKSKMIYYEYTSWGANSVYNSPDLLHRPQNAGHANNPLKLQYEVNTTTIIDLMNEFNIEIFEIIKIDVEGAEYEILDNLPKKCSKQLSVEFHDFLGLNPKEDVENYHQELLNVLSDYIVSYEQLEPLFNKPGHYQRDDSLYILKDLI